LTNKNKDLRIHQWTSNILSNQTMAIILSSKPLMVKSILWTFKKRWI